MLYIIPFAIALVVIGLAMTFGKDALGATLSRSYNRCEYDDADDPSHYWSRFGKTTWERAQRCKELGIEKSADLKLYGSRLNMQNMRNSSRTFDEFYNKVIEYNYNIIRPYVDKSVKWFDDEDMEYYNEGSYNSMAHLFYQVTGISVDWLNGIATQCRMYW